MKVVIQHDDFDVNKELQRLSSNSRVGGVASFVGYVRDFNTDHSVLSLHLEYYPGMAEEKITAYCNDAIARWDIIDVTVIHRVGTLFPTNQIVLVAVSAAHRKDAFEACTEIMEHLKTDIPFWKKETTNTGSQWLSP